MKPMLLKKTLLLKIRVTLEERETVLQAAREAKVTVSEYVRGMLFDEQTRATPASDAVMDAVDVRRPEIFPKDVAMPTDPISRVREKVAAKGTSGLCPRCARIGRATCPECVGRKK